MARNIEEFVILLNDKVTAKLQKVGVALDGVQNKANKTKSTFSSLGRLAAGAFAAIGVGQAVKSIASLGIQTEQTRVAFATFTGSAEKGNAVLEKLNEFANVTPFDNKQVIGAAKSLLAFGIPAEDLTENLKFLGDVSAGTGKDLKEMGIIFGQIRSTGKLMGQDLLQLINAGFNPLQEISRKTGESVESLKDKMSKGAISFDMVQDAFKSATSEGGLFFNMMEKQSQTVGGRISTLLGKAQLLGMGIGEALLPAMGALVDFGLAIIEGGDALTDLLIVLGTVATAFVALNAATIIAAVKMKILTAAQWLLNIAMNANPIGLVVAALAAVVAVIVLAWRNSEKFRGAVLGLWESMKVVASNMLKIFIEPFLALRDIFDGLIDLFTGKGGDKLLNGLKRYGKSILTFLLHPILQLVKGIDALAGTSLSERFKKFTGIGDMTEGVGKAFEKGFAKGADKAIEKTSKVTAGADKVKTPTTKTPTVPGKDRKVQAGISEIRSSAPKQINITIEKLIDEQNINTQTLPESAARIKEEVARALLAAVNDVNVIQG